MFIPTVPPSCPCDHGSRQRMPATHASAPAGPAPTSALYPCPPQTSAHRAPRPEKRKNKTRQSSAAVDPYGAASSPPPSGSSAAHARLGRGGEVPWPLPLRPRALLHRHRTIVAEARRRGAATQRRRPASTHLGRRGTAPWQRRSLTALRPCSLLQRRLSHGECTSSVPPFSLPILIFLCYVQMPI